MSLILNSSSEMSEIYPNFYQGSRPFDPADIIKQNFEVIVFCEDEHQPHQDDFPEITIFRCPMKDDFINPLSVKLIKQINAVTNSVITELNAGKKTLVVCYAGYNRSGLVAGVILNKWKNLDGPNCVRLLRFARHKNVLHNPIFRDYVSDLYGDK